MLNRSLINYNKFWNVREVSEILIYEVKDLQSARGFLRNYKNPVIITNQAGSSRYYGALVLDYIFKTLKQEFPQIQKIIFNISAGDNAAFFTARKLGYI